MTGSYTFTVNPKSALIATSLWSAGAVALANLSSPRPMFGANGLAGHLSVEFGLVFVVVGERRVNLRQ